MLKFILITFLLVSTSQIYAEGICDLLEAAGVPEDTNRGHLDVNYASVLKSCIADPATLIMSSLYFVGNHMNTHHLRFVQISNMSNRPPTRVYVCDGSQIRAIDFSNQDGTIYVDATSHVGTSEHGTVIHIDKCTY